MTTVAQPTTTHDANTRYYLDLMIDGMKPPERPDVGRWLPLVEMAESAYESSSNGNRGKLVAELLNSCIRTEKFPDLEAMLTGAEAVPSPEQSPRSAEVEPDKEEIMSALPENARLPAELSAGACIWLEKYIEYSKLVSPEGYEDFHEACGLWILSVIAARRIKIPFTRRQYTSLMMILVARGGLYIKSDTVEIAVDVLQAAGLRWLLGADETTPQKLMTDMAGILPKDYGDLDADGQYQAQRDLALSGQRGWYYDEFGELLQAMNKSNSVMQAFKGLLLKLDKCSDQYTYATQNRGKETITKPYLALIGCTTPPEIQSIAKSGSAFWSNGVLDRYAPICPPLNSSLDIPFKLGEIPVPYAISQPLRRWHERLGIPTVSVEEKRDEKGKITGYIPTRGELPEKTCQFGDGVWEAWANYRSALKAIAAQGHLTDLDGSYQRLCIKAIRVAALLASLENDNLIEMRHWAKAQEIAERWRKSLHELYSQVNQGQDEPSYAKKIEDEVLRVVRKLEEQDKPPTLRDLGRYLTKVDSGRIKMAVMDMLRAKILMEEKTAHAVKYRMFEEEA